MFNPVFDRAVLGLMTLRSCRRCFSGLLSQVPIPALSHAFLRPLLEQGRGVDWSRTSFHGMSAPGLHAVLPWSQCPRLPHVTPSGFCSRRVSGPALLQLAAERSLCSNKSVSRPGGMASAPTFPAFSLPRLPQRSCSAPLMKRNYPAGRWPQGENRTVPASVRELLNWHLLWAVLDLF